MSWQAWLLQHNMAGHLHIRSGDREHKSRHSPCLIYSIQSRTIVWWHIPTLKSSLPFFPSESWTFLNHLSYCSIAVTRHQDRGNFDKGNHLIGGYLTVSEVSSVIIMVGSMMVHSQTQCWRNRWEFYIQITRQQKEGEPLGLVWVLETPKYHWHTFINTS